MDNQDGSENNAKVSDSAYSNSCSNSQSRRSHSSKSTHSESNSSGSSGYGGKPSTSGSSNNLLPSAKKSKELNKKKKPPPIEVASCVVVETEARPPDPAPVVETAEVTLNVAPVPNVASPPVENAAEKKDISTTDAKNVIDEAGPSGISQMLLPSSFIISSVEAVSNADGFSFVISLNDGVVMYATASLTTSLGFPKHMWIGRSFIDFLHPRDRSTFAAQITSGLAVPKIVNGTIEKAPEPKASVENIVCRIRRYRGLTSGFGVKDKSFTFVPFLLNMSFKNISDVKSNDMYLVVQATPFFSAFKLPTERKEMTDPFVIRHAANGRIEYVDPKSVSYLGYLPQDLAGRSALEMYHIEDLVYLRQVYETIVKEGAFPRSRPYRMLTHNGDYLKLETKWTSFINPWSKKLEFITGEHHIIEGPLNPDVFQSPVHDRTGNRVSEEAMTRATILRETILRIMNEVLTKPAEHAKQQMTKRCQELAKFMETLLEEKPKPPAETLRVAVPEPETNCFERDSGMLGGLSPHHDYMDSKSSTETPLSYTQLNYNETLQRYFDSRPPHSFGEYSTTMGDNYLGYPNSLDPPKPSVPCLSPVAQASIVSSDNELPKFSSVSDNSNFMSYSPVPPMIGGINSGSKSQLTETLLSKHDMEMEKSLMKTHRASRSVSKGERVKASHETSMKKKEHLARCNASFQPTSATESPPEATKGHGVKRSSKQTDSDSSPHKHHCTALRTARREQRLIANNQQPHHHSPVNYQPSPGPAGPAWFGHPGMHPYILGVGIPQHMGYPQHIPIMGHQIPPGMFPMYYAPAGPSHMPPDGCHPSTSRPHFHPQPMPQMMYAPAMYGSPFMYAPASQTTPYNSSEPSMSTTPSMQYLNLPDNNLAFLGTCRLLPLQSGSPPGDNSEKKCAESQGTSMKTDHWGEPSNTNKLNRTIESDRHCHSRSSHSNKRSSTLEEGKTDEESSSSFYSWFFKTESGSAEESGDSKKSKSHLDSSFYTRTPENRVAKRKMEPPWMAQVCVTSELIYKYQIHTKSLAEVLLADKTKMSSMQQPPLVNEQLGQLYLDLQLNGIATRLTLEEGITSSGSSGEEATAQLASKLKCLRKKRDFNKQVITYEEDAPLPPPIEEVDEAEEEIDVTIPSNS